MSQDFLQPPDPKIVNKILSRLEELQVFVDPDAAAAVVASTLEWVTKTNDGKEFFVRLFGFDWQAGESDHVYHIDNEKGSIPGEDIYFLKTAVVQGQFIPPSAIEACKVEKEGCDECGSLSHCTRNVKDQKGRAINVCNHCLSHASDSAWRDKSGGTLECERCTVLLCQYHPSRNNKLRAIS